MFLCGQLLLAGVIQHEEFLGEDVEFPVAYGAKLNLLYKVGADMNGKEKEGQNKAPRKILIVRMHDECNTFQRFDRRPGQIDAYTTQNNRFKRPTFIMIWKSGTIIATPRNNAFKFSGSSWRPAYPGFIVMKKPHTGLRRMF